ncbi:MAG: N-acetyl-gamma-glutamyl-phosphate reductase [Spirochaetia bacterium]|jgi:N-acetyl-gamma-glutamyl-phosphate reductase|nr:N-acetyl-gamma-glutamyl-phosphate reductase [Spirochaetia bacterium]
MKAAILGISGYTGMILLRLLADHPDINEIIPVSSSKAGEKILSTDPGIGKAVTEKTEPSNRCMVDITHAINRKPDVVFAALPHLASAAFCDPFYGKSVVIDLSADLRIKDHDLFMKAYKTAPPRPEILKKAAYGLCEIYEKEIKKADVIANPGCYPTCTLLPVLPLAEKGVIQGKIITNALSGISGAGRKATINNLYVERTENTSAYLPGQTHRHFTEIKKEIVSFDSSLELYFTPHLVPLKRGMYATSAVELKSGINAEKIESIFAQYYGDKPFIMLKGSTLPESRDVWGSNRCDIAWQVQGNMLFLFSAIDNLVKGASGQAVQNMNIRFGLKESAGLKLYGEL